MPTSNNSSGIGFLLFVAGVVAVCCYTGLFYQTGAQYYDVCWRKLHANGKEPDSPELAAKWASCESTTDEAFYGAGYIFAGNPQYAVTPQLKAVQGACPNAYTEVPIGGMWIEVVNMIEGSGGARTEDKFASAKSTVLRVLGTKWSSCPSVARQNGFPPLVKVNEDWTFAGPCIPCKAEEAAMHPAAPAKFQSTGDPDMDAVLKSVEGLDSKKQPSGKP
jgi:hypothetical protein